MFHHFNYITYALSISKSRSFCACGASQRRGELLQKNEGRRLLKLVQGKERDRLNDVIAELNGVIREKASSIKV